MHCSSAPQIVTFSCSLQMVSLRIQQRPTLTTPAECSSTPPRQSRSESKLYTSAQYPTPPSPRQHTSWCGHVLFAIVSQLFVFMLWYNNKCNIVLCVAQIRDMNVLTTNVFKGRQLFQWQSSGNMAEIEFHGGHLHSKGSFRAKYSFILI